MENEESVNQWMRANRKSRSEGGDCPVLPAITCVDGFGISVQGHYGAYSEPRVSYVDWYSKVECGFPTAPVPELAQWKDGDKDNRESDTQSVFGFVPIYVVAELLNAHGGIATCASCDALRTQLSAAEAQLVKARKWVQHQPGCNSMDHDDNDSCACDCGLQAFLEGMK